MRLGLLRLLAGISAGVVACAVASGALTRGEEGAASPAPTRPLLVRGGLPASGAAKLWRDVAWPNLESSRRRGSRDFRRPAGWTRELASVTSETLVRLDERGELQPCLRKPGNATRRCGDGSFICAAE